MYALYRYPGLVHMVDILPTLVGLGACQGAEQQYQALATAGENSIPGLDGLDQWESITRQTPVVRTIMTVFNVVFGSMDIKSVVAHLCLEGDQYKREE